MKRRPARLRSVYPCQQASEDKGSDKTAAELRTLVVPEGVEEREVAVATGAVAAGEKAQQVAEEAPAVVEEVVPTTARVQVATETAREEEVQAGARKAAVVERAANAAGVPGAGLSHDKWLMNIFGDLPILPRLL